MAGQTIHTLLVDDEPVARKILREELEEVPDVEIVGEASNGANAPTTAGRCAEYAGRLPAADDKV